MHRFVARMRSSDPDVVEDLVQATFMTAFPNRDPFLHNVFSQVAASQVRSRIVQEGRVQGSPVRGGGVGTAIEFLDGSYASS
ncbi:MAG: hypothetical protein H0T89_26565 [Deltaproteobacteria bacterium]|nr:hypothetical protein [Deltaproteobacteria bacterium]MDQ3301605.1 hypothetical protein [Myxococcota bacterium]